MWPVLVVVGDTACQVLDALVAEVGQALGDARRLYGPAPAPGEWSSTGGLATGREAVAQSSHLRIDFRQFVGDVEWLACAESSSG